jgi:hypothetical protein
LKIAWFVQVQGGRRIYPEEYIQYFEDSDSEGKINKWLTQQQ